MKQTNNRWKNQFSGKELPNTLTMTCKKCGDKQTYCNKYSYRRAMGIGSDQTQMNRGMCGKCSRASIREPHGPRTSEQVDKMREAAILSQTPFDSVEEWMSSKVDRKEYYAAVDMMSRTNLRVNNLSLYKLYKANIYNGTNFLLLPKNATKTISFLSI